MSARTARARAIVSLFAALSFAAGCATVPERYVPRTVGPVDTGETIDGLAVRIWTDGNAAVLGRPITFNVSIRNTGPRAFWIPREPSLIFVWVYPNGQRDNFLREFPDSRHFSRADARLLSPGEEFTTQVTIKTHFFPKPGIVEFRALYCSEINTNPDLSPFWHGRATSNAYGVLLKSVHYGTAQPRSDRSAMLRQG